MLADALESVLNQTFGDFELIVVDDGSTDGTAELLTGYAGRLRVLSEGRRGVSGARNLGARTARGKWLAFLDSDDLWLPEKLELQLEALDSYPEYRFCHTDEVWVRRGRRVNPMNKHAKRGGRIFEYCLPMCRISPSSAMIEKKLFDSLGGFDTSYRVCEDYEFWLRLTACEPVLYLDRKLLVKRGGHDDQLSGSHWGFDRWRVRAIRKVLAGGTLDREQRAAAVGELLRKAEILEQGYAKRGKRLQALRYRRIISAVNSEEAELAG
jgi:glycosyltransferase involved in cell wall biosynthesis